MPFGGTTRPRGDLKLRVIRAKPSGWQRLVAALRALIS